MTVKELRIALSKYDQDAIVVVRASDHRFREAEIDGDQAEVRRTSSGRKELSEWDGDERKEPIAVLVIS